MHNEIFSNKFAVAPMLDWTDKYCRYFHRMLSKHALLYTEMIVADAIIHGDRQRFLEFLPILKPLALQLGGSDPKKLAKATSIAADYGYDEINLNVGCPSSRVQSGAFGACLMLEPQHVGECVAAMKAATTIPITVKCRIGVDNQDIEVALNDLAKEVMAADVDGFWVHARKAWLSGLSPKENRTIPPLNYNRVYKFKEKYETCFVGINGGIQNIDEALIHLQKVDAVMVGRAAYKNPMILTKVDSKIYNKNNNFNLDNLIENICEYANNVVSQGGLLSYITKHMLGLFVQQYGAKEWRQDLTKLATNKEATGEDLREIFMKIKNYKQ